MKGTIMRSRLPQFRLHRILGVAGFITSCGLLYTEKIQIDNYIARCVNHNVLYADKKRPDYIYIKYHIYKETMRKLKLKEEQDLHWINIIIHPIGKWWKTFKHSVAWRLLNIAQKGDKVERLKAIRQLVHIEHLKDWDFRHLAQICDARTAVSLARSGCDSRWFVPVHYSGVIKNPKIILNDLHLMLEKLRPHPCVEHFFKKYFPEQDMTEIDVDVDEFAAQSDLMAGTPDIELLKECIAFLHHLTKDEKASKVLIQQRGLNTLLELKKLFETDNEALATLCKTLANMSLVENCVEDFFVTGWITVLAEWRNHPDLRLQTIAAKALANLDYDDIQAHQYPPNIYPLYPKYRTSSKPKADVVFIHGLLGGVFITWRQRDRVSSEIGLYGKNAFYTNESDDVYILGEKQLQRNMQNQRNNNGNGNGNGKKSTDSNKNEKNNQLDKGNIDIKTVNSNMKESLVPLQSPIIHHKVHKTHVANRKIDEISDKATKELVEMFTSGGELSKEWEVVHPDCPITSSETNVGPFSISGDEWQNESGHLEYTNCWPMDWLPDDFPNIRIIGIDYTSAVTEWSTNYAKHCPCEKDQGHFDLRSANLLQRLARSNVGANGPIIWIGHSMGGLLTKHIILKSVASSDPNIQRLAKNTKGIAFLGTPHRGSVLAKWKQHMKMLIAPSIEVKELEEGEPRLLDLHERFMNCIRTRFRNLEIVSIAEGEPTMLTSFKFPLRIVKESSAFIDYGDFYVLKDDHLSLSKPIYPQSFLYQRLLKVIDKSMNSTIDGNFLEEGSNVLKQNLRKKPTDGWLSYLPSFWFNKFIVAMSPAETSENDDDE